MNMAHKLAIENIASTSRTNFPQDRQMQMMMIRSARNNAERHYIIYTILQYRIHWLNYLAYEQRKWQRNSRNPNKNNHGLESQKVREQYVRCDGKSHSYRRYYDVEVEV